MLSYGDALIAALKELDARQKGYIGQMTRGAPPDYPKYRELVVRVEETEHAIQTIRAIHTKFINQGEEA